MKQIVVISGKGGTGKTVVTAGLAALAKDAVVADCDVDAADLHLLLQPEVIERHEFRSGKTAVINKTLCTGCGKCMEVCRFEAVDSDFNVVPFSCEGCGLCARICPAGAITMEENLSGEWFVSKTRFGPFVHARLGIAEENSGKLVTAVKRKAAELAAKHSAGYILVDGPPGIGCPVIASLSGADLALIVTEPTLSGLHDAGRVIDTALRFKVAPKVVINKHDINEEISTQIESYCAGRGIDVAGKIPFDGSVVASIAEGKTVMERGAENIKETVKKIWETVK